MHMFLGRSSRIEGVTDELEKVDNIQVLFNICVGVVCLNPVSHILGALA